jgi:hypothetical protein
MWLLIANALENDHDVAGAVHLEDITDPWLRQAIQNEAVRRWGPRQQEKNHGR